MESQDTAGPIEVFPLIGYFRLVAGFGANWKEMDVQDKSSLCIMIIWYSSERGPLVYCLIYTEGFNRK